MSKKYGEVLLMLEDFFTNYLTDVKGLSDNSIAAYQYAFQLLFQYLLSERGLQPDKVTFQDLSGDTIESFLLYLENERACSVKTRNLTLLVSYICCTFLSAL